ncbi:MAG: NAD-dependent epimerase/dehydratase family protein [Kiritimatiellae bacterium]|nr:NAD-dependent epimerase/dehydratase family protein [Kiritimatiellia bacterium]
MHYLVTGGAGFIGSNIVHTLVDQGRSVRVFDNFSTGRRENLAQIEKDIEIIEGDLCDVPSLKKAIKGVRYILHLGALPSVPRSIKDPLSTHEVNVTGTLNLLIEARKENVERLVFSSSSSVYGDTATLPKHEDLVPNPLSSYALSKLAGEHYCRIFHELHGLDTFSLRYFNVFGPRQDPLPTYAAVIPKFISALSHNKSPIIYGDGNQSRDFTFVKDVVAANLCCCTASKDAAGKVYNVGRGNRTTVLELAGSIASILDRDIEPIHEASKEGDVRDSQADSSRAQKLLKWNPEIDLEDGLRHTVKWFAGN